MIVLLALLLFKLLLILVLVAYMLYLCFLSPFSQNYECFLYVDGLERRETLGEAWRITFEAYAYVFMSVDM